MIIWKTKEVPDDRDEAACHGHRKVLNISIGWLWFDISWSVQGRLKEKWTSKKNDTRLMGDVWGLCLNLKHWSFGEDHFWYDGPHCVYSFGCFHYRREYDDCKKCGK